MSFTTDKNNRFSHLYYVGHKVIIFFILFYSVKEYDIFYVKRDDIFKYSFLSRNVLLNQYYLYVFLNTMFNTNFSAVKICAIAINLFEFQNILYSSLLRCLIKKNYV